MARVDIVIVNWNGLRYLQPCLDALQAQTFRDYQVWIVDNGSIDGSPDFIRTHYPAVSLLCLSHNKGFAHANNQAIQRGDSEFVATLNNDTTADPMWLQTLVNALDAQPSAGVAASKMLFANRPTIINTAGINIDRMGIAWDRAGGSVDDIQDVTPLPVFGASAGAALYRRAMLNDIGVFDDDFFAYLEDVDLAWRAQWAGWQAVYVPASRVMHHHSATSGEGSPFKNRLLGRNKVWLIAKNYPLPYLWLYLPLIVFYDAASVFYAVIARRECSPWLGRLDGLRRLPYVLRHRRARIRRIGNSAMMRLLSPVDMPWRVLLRYRHLKPKG